MLFPYQSHASVPVSVNTLESDSDLRTETIFCFVFSKKMKRETTPQ